MNLVSVDPGVKECYFALWKGPRLVSCFALPVGDAWSFMLRVVACVEATLGAQWDLAIEVPQVYVRGRSKGDPNDLIDLAFACGVVAAACPGDVTRYKPAAWKGQVLKGVTEARLREKLDPVEIAEVTLRSGIRSAKLHNAFDAVGIGFHHLRSLKLR